MTKDRLLAIIADRGFKLRLSEAGVPYLVGPPKQATPALMALVSSEHYRPHLIAHIRASTPVEKPDFVRGVECRWPKGAVCRHSFPEMGWPAKAVDWRHVGEGEDAWKPIPGARR